MSFGKAYNAVLSPFVKEYRKAKNEKERRGVVNKAIDAIEKSKALLEDGDDLPKDLQTVCICLFSCIC